MLSLFPLRTGKAQDTTIRLPDIQLSTIVMVNHGSSYITFPTDIGNIAPLWFEANLIPNFYIRKSKNARLMGVLTPQFIIRMYQEPSYPVRTPSYIPQVSIYYMLPNRTKLNSLSFFGKFIHHSNGQDGEFYLEDGEINFKTGNFSTNYLEFGMIKTNYMKKFNAVQFLGSSFEIYPPGLTAKDLHPMYSLFRWKGKFSIFKIPVYNKQADQKEKAHISLRSEIIWMFGEINDWEPLSAKRINLTFLFYYHPGFFEDIGLFTGFYHGSDYYNIYYFGHQVTMLRFGIMTDKLTF